MVKAGYVYAMSNDSMPGLIKIGMTTVCPDKRAKELYSSSGITTPFEVVHSHYCADAKRAEKIAHSKLSKERVSRRREFFLTHSYLAQIAIDRACDEVNEHLGFHLISQTKPQVDGNFEFPEAPTRDDVIAACGGLDVAAAKKTGEKHIYETVSYYMFLSSFSEEPQQITPMDVRYCDHRGVKTFHGDDFIKEIVAASDYTAPALIYDIGKNGYGIEYSNFSDTSEGHESILSALDLVEDMEDAEKIGVAMLTHAKGIDGAISSFAENTREVEHNMDGIEGFVFNPHEGVVSLYRSDISNLEEPSWYVPPAYYSDFGWCLDNAGLSLKLFDVYSNGMVMERQVNYI